MSRSLVFALGVAIGILACYLVWHDRLEWRHDPTDDIDWRGLMAQWRDLEQVDSV